MDFRLINKQSLDQVKSLWDYCFEKADTSFFQWYFQEYALKQNKIVGGFEDNKLQTMVHLNPYTINLKGKEERMPYLVGVATAPEARGRHVISGLLKTSFTLAKAMLGSKAVLLQPIYAGIYQPYGFAYTHLRTSYKMPLQELNLPHIDDGLQIARIPTETAENILSPIYSDVMGKYNGFVVRDSRVWHNFLKVAAAEKKETAIVLEDNNPVGYVLYEHSDNMVKVLELMSTNGRIRNRILAYLRVFAGDFKNIEWLGAIDDTAYLNFKNQQYAPQIAPFMMGRVIDLPGILQSVAVPATESESSIVLFVQDEFIKSNNLLLQLNISAKGIELRDTIKVPEITMDITTFTQLYFGTYSVEQLWANDKIMADDQTKLQILSRLFPAQKNYINEYF